MPIIAEHPNGTNPFAISLISTDCMTANGIEHRAIEENGHRDVFLEYMENALPLSVSNAMLDDIDKFKTLAISFMLSTDIEEQINQTNNIVCEIEIWSNAKAANLMESIPDQQILDHIRRNWISGLPLSDIVKTEPEASKITKEYYGFALPWIIHAISQMFASESEKAFAQTYTSIAMFVELGLPNVTSANIYMAGVRSRSAALELSTFDVFKDRRLTEIKQILADFTIQDCNLSDSSEVWIELLSKSAKAQRPRKVSFPTFTWEGSNLPNKLYLRETNGECFLFSSDDYFYEKVESTDNLPFLEIANIMGLYFEKRNNIWHLQSYDPRITIE